MKPKIIVILGPTASGKSDLAIRLAKKFNGEIISADSRQIYKEMDIGTAKPPKDNSKFKIQKSKVQVKIQNDYISAGVPHHLLDIKSPNQPYTVAQYKRDAVASIKKVLKNGNLPILCGGAGLYLKVVIENLKIPEARPNTKLRKKLEKELELKGLNFLYEKLIKLDPEAAYIIDSKNPRRVVRALEITMGTKRPFSKQREKGEKLFNALEIGINLPMEKLKQKINKRVDLMVKSGLINEVKKLIAKYPANSPVFDAIGYKEIIAYLKDRILLSEAVDLIKKNTWHYAKRQLTWFKKNEEIKWVRNYKEAEKLVGKFLN